jgi:hypothetical protein
VWGALLLNSRLCAQHSHHQNLVKSKIVRGGLVDWHLSDVALARRLGRGWSQVTCQLHHPINNHFSISRYDTRQTPRLPCSSNSQVDQLRSELGDATRNALLLYNIFSLGLVPSSMLDAEAVLSALGPTL